MSSSQIVARQLISKRKELGLCMRCGGTKGDSYSTCLNCRSQFRHIQIARDGRKKINSIRNLKKVTNNKIDLLSLYI